MGCLRKPSPRSCSARYKTPVGEIDRVALKAKRLAFVEVKQRRRFEDAGWALPTRARHRIVRAAQYWLSSHPDFAGHDIAFDVVLPAPWSGLTISRTHFPFKRATGLACPLPLWADRPLKGMVESLARLCL
jgi:Holliday junction resolvase-like predicted endonuclease